MDKEIKEMQDEKSKLRAFANEIMSHWPEGGVDGADIQDYAIKHGLIEPVTRHNPCSESCYCSEFVSAEEFKHGITCFVKTELLKCKDQS